MISVRPSTASWMTALAILVSGSSSAPALDRAAVAPAPGTGPATLSLDAIESLVSAFDTPGAGPALEAARVMDELPQAVLFLDDHLTAHPEDSRAVVLAARVALMAIAFEETGGRPRSVPAQDWLEGVIKRLEGLLAGNPGNAEVHYWAAQCYGLGRRDPGGLPVVAPQDAERAVAHARRAREISPGEARYEEFLLDVLLQTDRLPEAAVLARGIQAASGDALRLLEDLREIGVPAGATYLLRESRLFGSLQMMEGRIADFPDLRARIYRVHGSISDVEAHYAAKHPGFRLITQTSEDGGLTGRAQWLRPGEDAWRPAPAAAALDEDQMNEGVFLAAIPGAEIPPERRSRFGASEGEEFVVLMLTNHRPSGTAGEPASRTP